LKIPAGITLCIAIILMHQQARAIDPVFRICPAPGYYDFPDTPAYSNALPFKSFFRADSIPGWDQVRSQIDYFGGWDSSLHLCPEWDDPADSNMLSGEGGAFDILHNRMHIPLSLETECLWYPDYMDGEEAYEWREPHWSALTSWGAEIRLLTLDEPFRRMDEINPQRIPPPLNPQQAAEEIAEYIQLVHENYPLVRVELMEPYPYFTVGEILNRIDRLNIALDGLGEDPLEGFVLDPNWMLFDNSGWPQVKALEDSCTKRSISFGLIYWASWAANDGYPEGYFSHDSDWYSDVMHEGQFYQDVGGSPDEYIIQSWLWIPRANTNEDSEATFARTVVDFYNAYFPK